MQIKKQKLDLNSNKRSLQRTKRESVSRY